MLLQLTPSIALLLRSETDKRCASIHLCYNKFMYECIAAYETSYKIFDFSSMDSVTLAHLEECYITTECNNGFMRVDHKRRKVLEESDKLLLLSDWKASNEADKTFVEPPATTIRRDPGESRILYMSEPTRFPGIKVYFIRQETPSVDDAPRHTILFLRMELPRRERVYGVDDDGVDFISASNIKLEFETLESELE
jgi:hypothetical protein